MKYIRLLAFIYLLLNCFAYGSQCAKTYEFVIDNQLHDKLVKIVPKSEVDFWIGSNESYLINSGEKYIVGSKIVYDEDKNATDLYHQDDIIAFFDVYLDEVKQEKQLYRRKYWRFSLGKAINSGKYTLLIDETILNK